MNTTEKDAIFDSPEFKVGLDIGKSLGSYEAQAEAQRAYDAGEIELWLAHVKPKTLEGWEEWRKEHGDDIGDRWKPQ